MQFDALPVVAHISTVICLMWIELPTRVEDVEPPVIDAVIQVDDSVVVMLAGTIAISMCLVSITPGLDAKFRSPARRREPRGLILRRLEVGMVEKQFGCF